jgi:hypothetical protein
MPNTLSFKSTLILSRGTYPIIISNDVVAVSCDIVAGFFEAKASIRNWKLYP